MSDIEAAALLARSAADAIRMVEEMICRMRDAKHRSRAQHQVIAIARNCYNAIVKDGDIKDSASLVAVAEAIGKAVGRRHYVPPAADPNRKDTAGQDVF